MADLAPAAAEVLPTSTTILAAGIALEAINAGQPCYLDPTTRQYKLFDANDTSRNTETPAIAMNTAAAGQPIRVATGGDITLGATAAPVAGTIYVASGTVGKIAPAADIVTGWRVNVLGVGKATNKLALILNNSGVTP
jgi:hypothetical protein